MITAKLFLRLPHQVSDELDELMDQFKVDNPFRLIHFLAQTAHESNYFKSTFENLNYSEEALLRVFPRYFSKDTAKAFARKPEAIANTVYSNRMGNGDNKSGEGWKYRGRGYLQITGKANYKALSDYFGIDFVKDPDRVAYQYALRSAGWYFEKRNLWRICDEGTDELTIRKVSYQVNGGYNGMVDRIEKTRFFEKLLL